MTALTWLILSLVYHFIINRLTAISATEQCIEEDYWTIEAVPFYRRFCEGILFYIYIMSNAYVYNKA